MKLRVLYFACLIFFSVATAGATSVNIRFLNKIIRLPDSTEGALFVSQPDDEYTHQLSPFDLQIRLGMKDQTERDYLSAAGREVRSWSGTQEAEIKKGLADMEAALTAMHLHFTLPDTVRIINSTNKNEFGAEGYTRSAFVVLNPDNPEGLSIHILAHELFHVFSRYNHDRRDEIYASIGFRKCNPVDYRKAIGGRNISNPDCPVVEHYATLMINNKPTDVALIIYSKKDFKQGEGLGDLVEIGLLKLNSVSVSKQPALDKNGAAVIYSLDEGNDLFNKVGNNTPYLLHPEEISAEHFVMMLTSKKANAPQYPEAIKKILMK